MSSTEKFTPHECVDLLFSKRAHSNRKEVASMQNSLKGNVFGENLLPVGAACVGMCGGDKLFS